MDVFQFINSKDIAAHLKSIDYPFSALEIAFLISQSEHTTLKQRHAAFCELIATYPDTAIEKRPNTRAYPSLFALLKRYMEIENAQLETFNTEKDAAYRFRYHCKGDHSYIEKFESVFPSLALCKNAMQKEIDYYGLQEAVHFYEIRMNSFSAPKRCVTVKMTPAGEVIDVEANGLCDEEESDLLSAFDGMWFPFPTPFRRGDILIPRYGYRAYERGTPVVLSALSTWTWEEYQKNGFSERDYSPEDRARLYNLYQKNGDTSDMTVLGYFGCKDGSFYWECEGPLLNYEYCAHPLTGGLRILNAVSEFEKGELDVADLVKVSYLIRNEQLVREERSYIHLPDDFAKKLGLD